MPTICEPAKRATEESSWISLARFAGSESFSGAIPGFRSLTPGLNSVAAPRLIARSKPT